MVSVSGTINQDRPQGDLKLRYVGRKSKTIVTKGRFLLCLVGLTLWFRGSIQWVTAPDTFINLQNNE